MEQSPLSQLARPEKLQPKIVELYQSLFADNDEQPHIDFSEGFWREFFLLRPDKPGLDQILGALPADALLHFQNSTQQLFSRAVEAVKSRIAPADENGLDTLTVFLENVLRKKYNSPSSDIITVIGGLDGIDAIFSDFVAVLDSTIRDGRSLDVRQKAARTCTAAVAGAYQTGIVSYFINRDLFPSLTKLLQDADTHNRTFAPLMLLGLLANYNKFEFQNPYRLRLEDYVNDAILSKTANAACEVLEECRDQYLQALPDSTEGWTMPRLTLGSALSMFGVGPRNGARPNGDYPSEEEIKQAFSSLPPPETAVLLPVYDLTFANKLFCLDLVNVSQEERAADKSSEKISNLGRLLSFGSYLFQNAHRNTRSSQYANLLLLILRVLIEDAAVAKAMTTSENAITARLCRQRQPFLPALKDPQLPILLILDMAIDGINHNLRRRLDTELYSSFLDIILRILSFLSASRARLTYHWSELWRSLLSFVRFLTSYAPSLQQLRDVDEIVDSVCNILAFALSAGEGFLPDAKSYDDLFYKVFESGEHLVKFRDSFGVSARPSAGAAEVLTNVASHFNTLLEEQKAKGNKHFSPREVTKLIKQGYESLSIQSRDEFDRWIVYREVDHKNLLKRVTRLAVADMKALLAVRGLS